MAFQVGTRVDPRLGALDFSGFTNAANIQAASLLKLGEAIGEAIEEHQEKKIKKQQDKVNIKALKGLSDQFGFNLDDLSASSGWVRIVQSGTVNVQFCERKEPPIAMCSNQTIFKSSSAKFFTS